jgi:hypothetical protein
MIFGINVGRPAPVLKDIFLVFSFIGDKKFIDL